MEALFYQKLKNKLTRCQTCEHFCVIKDGGRGICGIRENQNGRLLATNYGQIVAAHIDPVEKKPLYHFHPGERILSVGTNGCNLGCQFCQNWSISQMDSSFEEITPDGIIALAVQYNTKFIAYTYNEPFVWYEYVLDSAKAAKNQGFINVLVTNGYVNPEPLKEAYLKGQFKFKNKVLPPNCDNNAYYKDMNICKSDNLCLKIKNPVNYSKRKSFMQSNKTDSKPGRVKLTEEQKKMRREYRQKIEQEKTNNIDRKGQ